jgi:2-(1,2-epoxy-1,2-dihydrophenyl)acetyl-CoA isomerase
MSDYETVLIEREGRVARVSFNRPEKLNSFNGTLRREFLRAAQEVNADNDIWVVVLTGAGRAFGAGADLSDTSETPPNGAEGVEDQLNSEYKPGVLAIHHARKPWIAAVNGPCAGISYSYAMACDLMVMAESSYLFQPFIGIGLVPDGGATWLLPSLVGAKRAYELMAFGEKLGAEKAVEWGLANRMLPDDDFAGHAMSFAQELAGRSPMALRYAKEALAFAATHNLSDAISKEAALQPLCIGSDDAKEAIKAFFEKRQPNWQGK